MEVHTASEILAANQRAGDEALRHLFTYHPPSTPELVEKYQHIREAGLHLALLLHECCPPGPDRTVAIRCVREAVMNANTSIANGGVAYC